MNRQAVQEIYNRVNEPRNISAIEALGLKSCLYCDLFGTFSVENISDTDVYIQVKSKLQDLCWYALNAKPEPVAKDCNGNPICIGGTVWFDDEEYLVRAYKPASADNNERILATCCDVWETPMWLYLGGNDVTVRNPNAQCVDFRSTLQDIGDAIKALQDTLQKDGFDKLEKVLESLREAQKD